MLFRSQNLSSTRPALIRSSAKAGQAVKVVDPSVTKAATLLRTRPQIRASKPKGLRSSSNPSDSGTNTGRFDASGVSKRIFSNPSSPKTLPIGFTSSSLSGECSDFFWGKPWREDESYVFLFYTLYRRCQQFDIIDDGQIGRAHV